MVGTEFFQNCGGVSMVILSLAGSWSMVSGAIVKINVAGTNISVNEKLQRVERITQDLEESTQQLKLEPGVSPLKIEAIERELEAVNEEIDSTELQLSDDLDKLVEPEL